MKKDKIFETYFKQNEKTDDLAGQEANLIDQEADLADQEAEKGDVLGSAAIRATNKVVNALPKGSPIKNKQTALSILTAIKKEAELKMQDPNHLAAMLDDIAGEISAELAENKKIKVKIS